SGSGRSTRSDGNARGTYLAEHLDARGRPVLVAAARPDLRLCLQLLDHSELADRRLHDEVVQLGVARSGRARCARPLAEGGGVGHGRRDRARHRSGGRRQPLQVLRPRRDHVPARPADRVARRRDRHRTELVLRQQPSPSLQSGVADDRDRPRDLLHRDRLQQRRRAAAPHPDVADGGVDGPGRRRLADVPLRDAARRLHSARGGRAACVRSVVRRGDRHHVHRRGAEHLADLDPRQPAPRTAAAAGERGGLFRDSHDRDSRRHRRAPDARHRDSEKEVVVSTTVSKHQNLVGGEWVDSAGGETMEVLNPATGEVIAEVPAATAEDVDRAVQAAKKALPEWLDTTPAERAEALLKLATAIDGHADELAELESQNVGKPLSYAKDELPVCSDNLRFFAGAARVLEGKSTGEYMRGYTSMLRREPLGIVAGITPWNYPLMMAVWKLGPALAAGNVQVVKPSEQTPLTTLRFVQLAHEAGLVPAGVLNVITGDGVPVGEGLVKHPDVRLVSLTGDVETGKIIARTAADTLKRVHLELGGKAPVVVFDDADPAAVAEGIKIAGYWNSGQDCTAASR